MLPKVYAYVKSFDETKLIVKKNVIKHEIKSATVSKENLIAN